MINQTSMTDFEFFTESLEHKQTPSDHTEDYNEGYADPIDSVLYAIRSGDISNLRDLDEVIQHINAPSEDFSEEFAKGYKDSMGYILKQFTAIV